MRGRHRLLVPIRKLLGGLRHVPWSCVLERLSIKTFGVIPPHARMSVRSQDRDIQLVRFADRDEFWLPATCPLDEYLWSEYLSACWEHPSNGHYYLHYRPFFPSEAVVIDCGAFCGFFTQLALSRGAGRLIAAEPNPQMANCLRRTFAHEIESGRVTIIEAAVGQTESVTKFACNAMRPYGGSVTSDTDAQDVRCVSLDATVSQIGISRCDFLKMDIEGFEIQALLGALSMLEGFLPSAALAAYHREADARMIQAILRSCGYSRITARGLRKITVGEAPRAVMVHAEP